MTRSRNVTRKLAIAAAMALLALNAGGGAAAAAADQGSDEAASHQGGNGKSEGPNEHADEHAATGQEQAPAAAAAESSDDDADLSSPQPPSNADFSGNGANEHGAYDSTRDGSASENGNGDGAAAGRPCAGCVGKADNKNPAGQAPDGTDANKGYECDGNSGVGRTNPAHSGCLTASTEPPVPVLVFGATLTRTLPEVLPTTTVRAAPPNVLATTGSGPGLTTAALVGMAMVLLGALLLRSRRTV